MECDGHVDDLVTETNATASAAETDTIYSYVAAYTLGANVEQGRVVANGVSNLTGNALDTATWPPIRWARMWNRDASLPMACRT